MGGVSLQPERVTISLTDRALTVGLSGSGGGLGADRSAFDTVIAWDRAGRPYSVWRDARTCRRGLSGRVLEKSRDAGITRRRWLDDREIDALVDDAAACAATAIRSTRDEASAEALGRAAAFDASAARRDASRFARIYSDVGMLPPDQYLAVVVQATEGCSIRTCEFCGLFDRPYRVKTPEQFDRHVADVREYMGDSLRLRGRSAFVGAANALALPTARVEIWLSMIRSAFGESIPIAGFVDGHSGSVKTAADYERLAAAGLWRVYVGLESGHDPLLAFVRKPSRAADAIDAVRAMKQGRLRVALIVMLGLGGEQFARAHATDTIAALNRMPLGAGDVIYFSDLVAPQGGRYETLAADAGIAPLDACSRRLQKEQIRSGLRFAGAPPQMATYDIREFVY